MRIESDEVNSLLRKPLSSFTGRPFKFGLFFTLVLWAPSFGQPLPELKLETMNEAFHNLEHSASRSRIIGGGISILMGLTSGVAGFLLVIDPAKPVDEGLVGLSLFTLGGINLYDGFSRMVGTSSAEFIIPHFKNFGEGKPTEYGGVMEKREYAIRSLMQLAEYGHRVRLFRGTLDLLSSACYWYLFSKGDKTNISPDSPDKTGKDIYRYALIPAIALFAVGGYRLLFRSTEERVWDRAREGHPKRVQSGEERWDIFASITPNLSMVGLVIAF